ncbi:hypothetical protein quinque_010428 [Culex quinquefasciatus]
MTRLLKLLSLLISFAIVTTTNSSHFLSSNLPNEPQLVIDLVSFLKVPLKVTLLVCWSKEETADFIRQVNWPSFRIVAKPVFIEAKSDSVEHLRFLDTREPHQQLVVVDVACPRTGELLLAARHRIYHRVRWVLLDGQRGQMEPERRVFDAVGSLPVTGSSEVYYFSTDLIGGNVSIRNVYRNSMQRGLISEEIAIWCNGVIDDRRAGRSVSVRRKNLHQLPLRTTLLYTDTYTLDHFDDYENPQIDTPNRLSYLMINSLYRIYLNATFVKRYSTTWCYPNPKTGGLIGVCVDLINNHSEVGAFMFITTSRLKMMDFLPLGMEGTLSFIFKAPKLSIMNNIFELPFDPNVWVCLFSLVFVLGVTFYLMTKLNDFKTRPLRNKDNSYDQVFNAVSITLQQGSVVSKSGTQRTVVLTPSEQINSLTELLNSRLEVGGLDIPYNHFYLTTSTEPVRKAIYEQKIRLKNGSLNMFSLDEGVARVKKGLFALHVQIAAAEQLISETFDDTEKCYLRKLNFVDYTVIYLAVQRNFTIREHFQFIMIRLKAQLSCVKGTDFQPLSVVDVRFAMEVIGVGLLGTLLVLAAEVGWSRYQYNRLPVFEYVE